MTPILWVIEMRCNGRWEPTVGAGLSRADARREVSDYWKTNNPRDRFRVVKYIRADAARRMER